jgi:hypothetical protein
MSNSSNLRVADVDRENLGDELREHLVAGRLSSEEFEDRLGSAYEATTRADLDALRADLPASPASVQRALVQRRAHLRGRLVQEAGGTLMASVVCVGIWLASGSHGSFWPIWVILFALLPLARDLWRLYGPAPEQEAVEAHIAARRVRRPARVHRRSHHRGLHL